MLCAAIEKQGKEIENLVIQEREDLVARGENIRVRVTATAISMPSAPSRLPRTAVLGWASPFRAEMNRTAARR